MLTLTKELDKVYNPFISHFCWHEHHGAVRLCRRPRLASRNQIKAPIKCTCTDTMVIGPEKHSEQLWIWLRHLGPLMLCFCPGIIEVKPSSGNVHFLRCIRPS